MTALYEADTRELQAGVAFIYLFSLFGSDDIYLYFFIFIFLMHLQEKKVHKTISLRWLDGSRVTVHSPEPFA